MTAAQKKGAPRAKAPPNVDKETDSMQVPPAPAVSAKARPGANLPALRKAARAYVAKGWTLVPVRDKKPMTLKGKVEAAQPRRSSLRTIV